MEQDSVRTLFVAIVRQAVKDWRDATRWLKGHPNDSNANKLIWQARIDECERFFRSEWFSVGCRLDGEALLDALKRYEGERDG